MKEHLDKGFVKLQRNLLDWEWYQDGNTARLMLHLLLKANYTAKRWQGILVNPGELITSYNNLSKELKVSESIIRTSLARLKKTGYIITKSTNKFTRITIVKSAIYDGYKIVNHKQNDSESTGHSLSDNNQITTTNNVNKEKDIIERKDVFKKQIFQFESKYSKDILSSFFNNWTQEDGQTGRMKFEDEKYWDLQTRLTRWIQYNSSKPEKRPIYKNR